MVSRREDGPSRGLRSTTDETSDRVSGLRAFPYIHTVSQKTLPLLNRALLVGLSQFPFLETLLEYEGMQGAVVQ